MKFIFFIASFHSLFFSVLLGQKKPRSLHDRILILWLVYLGLYIGVYALNSHELFTNFHLLSISLISLLMLPGPFLYEYISALVSNRKHLDSKDFLHLLPFILFNLYIIFGSFFPGLSQRLDMEKVAPGYDPPLLFVIFLITTAFSGTFYFFLTLKLFKKLDIQIYHNFSNTAGVDLFWIRRLTEIFAVVWTALIGITVIHHAFGLFSMAFCTDGLFLSLSVFVILIGYFGFKQKIIYAAEPVGDTIQNKYAGARLNVPEAKKLSKHLKEYMEASKPYLDPELTLPQLADKVGMTTHLLSQLINDQFGMNFFDFINRYRVEEVKQKLNDPAFSHYSLLGMAFECGFNSKSAFNRVFKKSTGVTPSQFKESVHQLS